MPARLTRNFNHDIDVHTEWRFSGHIHKLDPQSSDQRLENQLRDGSWKNFGAGFDCGWGHYHHSILTE